MRQTLVAPETDLHEHRAVRRASCRGPGPIPAERRQDKSRDSEITVSSLFIQITLGDGELENHSSTTEELRQCCKDIRVLGRKELRYWGNWARGKASRWA